MTLSQKKFYPWLVVALLWVVALLNYMDRQMLSTMRDAMAVDIADLESKVMFGKIMAAFMWIYGFMSPVSGIVADRINRKWLIVASLAVWSTVTLLMGYATTYEEIYWLRAAMGVSEALYIPAALSLIADYFTGKQLSLAIGIHMTGLYMGQAVGGFGAFVAAHLSWQSTFHWFGIVGIAYALVLIFFLHEKRVAASAGAARGEQQPWARCSAAICRLSDARWACCLPVWPIGPSSSSLPPLQFPVGPPRTGFPPCLPTVWASIWCGQAPWQPSPLPSLRLSA